MDVKVEFDLGRFLRERDELKEKASDWDRIVRQIEELRKELFNAYCRIYKVSKNEVEGRRVLFFGSQYSLTFPETYCSEKAFKVKLSQKKTNGKKEM